MNSKKKLRFMQAHTMYPNYLYQLYHKARWLSGATFQKQVQTLISDAPEVMYIFAPYMGKHDFDTQFVVTNCEELQVSWARENGVAITENWVDDILRVQIERYEPDVLFIEPMSFSTRFLKTLSYKPRLVIGWRGAFIYSDIDWSAHDVILSGLPKLLDFAVKAGAKEGVYFIPGVPAWIHRTIESLPRTTDVCFYGSLHQGQYDKRYHLLKVIARAASIHGFSFAVHIATKALYEDRDLSPHLKKPVYGMEMHQILRSSHIVFDDRAHHGVLLPDGTSECDLGKEYTTNMRLFEGTAAESLVLTEYLPGLNLLFEPEVEVATYRDENELVEKLLFYLANTAERTKIAKAGKKRNLENWTMEKATKKLTEIIMERI